MMKTLCDAIGAQFPLTELPAGEYATLKANGMTFHIRRYYAKGLGAVSAMEASGFFGLMKMGTLIVNPTEKDMPLLSYDRVHAMGNDTLIFELYDTLLGNAQLAELEKAKLSGKDLPDHDLGNHWYDSIKLPVSLAKKGKKQQRPAFDALTRDYVDAFLRDSLAASPCDARPKREKASVYVEGLLKNGGPSTDVFKKAIGDEKTAELFRRILFATAL